MKPSLDNADAYARLVADKVGDIVVLTDAERRIRFVTPSCRALGYAPEEMVGKDAVSFSHPDDAARMEANISRLAAGERTDADDRRYRLRLKDASYRWYESTPTVLTGDDGGPSGLLTCLRDVTDHLAAETALADAEARYRLVADSIGDIVVQLDADDRVTYVSPSCALLGYTPEEWMGRRAADLIHPGERTSVTAAAKQLLGGKDSPPGRKRARLRHKDGSWRWFDGRPSRITDETGATVGIVNVLRDVTDQVAAEAAAAEAEARHRLLADSMRDLVVQLDAEDRLTYVSPSCVAIGYTPEEMVGRRGSDFIHPDERPGVEAAVAILLSGLDLAPGPKRNRLRRKDGSFSWFEGCPARITDETGATVGIVNVLRDITEKWEAEQALLASESRYRLVADNMTDLLACSGRDGRLSFVAGAWMDILGYEPHEMLGRDAPSFVHPDDLERVRDEFRNAVRAGPGAGAFRVQYRAQRKDGVYVWLEAHPRAFFSPEGEFIEFQDIVRDISDHKALEERLENIAKARAEFLADLSHELRGPLNSIQGLARLARERRRTPETLLDYMTRIEQATGALLVQVEDVLEFSRLDAAKVVFRPRPVELDSFLRAALAQYEPAAQAKRLQLEYAPTAFEGLTLSFDPDRLRQVVLNLLDNAVKFTRAGSIRLEAGYDLDAGRLTITVADTGLGVPADQIQQLFQRFVQVSDAPSYRGAGLGLSISKRIVEGMGGEIGATSVIGSGSRFTFWIAAPVADAEDGDQADAASAPLLRVLVADADPEVGAFVVDAFGDVSAEVLTATDGTAALDLAAREPVDLILIDLALPPPDAHAVLRRLRRRRGLNMLTPAVAMVADASELSADGVQADGFETLVPKPLTRIELVSAIVQTLRSPEPPPTAPTARTGGRRPRTSAFG